MNPVQTLVPQLTDAIALTATLFGEARGEPVLGQIAVACVVRNRVRQARVPRSYVDVCTAPWQFSCWHEDGANRDLTLLVAHALVTAQPPGLSAGELRALRQCAWIAAGVISGELHDDPTGSATHYLTAQLFQRKPPSWAIDQPVLATIGAHVFLRVRG